MVNPEDGRKRDFLVEAFRKLGHTLVRIHEHREEHRKNGDLPHLDISEIIGETPIGEVPIQIVLDKAEIDPPSKRLQALRTRAQATNHRIIIAAAAGTGIIIATIGTAMAVKHLIDRNPHSDITDK